MNKQQQQFFWLGRQPALSRAELEARLGPSVFVDYAGSYALLDLSDVEVNANNFGGIIKRGLVLAESESDNWNDISNGLILWLNEYQKTISSNKITLGLSVEGLDIDAKRIQRFLSTAKASMAKQGKNLRTVGGQHRSLNSAQVLHNQLYKPNKLELSVVRFKGKVLLVQTTWVQNLESYTKRDRQRPARDSKVGMLPPKLAQILINLALGPVDVRNNALTLLDPFCGTGVVLQEARLLGINVVGTDLEDRMIDYSQTNMNWLDEQGFKYLGDFNLSQGDAQDCNWIKLSKNKISHIAAETYLGPALFNRPPDSKMTKIVQEINQLHVNFLSNLHKQIEPDVRIALGIPAWATKNGSFIHLPLLDQLQDLGYTRVVNEHSTIAEMIYHRPDQLVAREIVVLTKK